MSRMMKDCYYCCSIGSDVTDTFTNRQDVLDGFGRWAVLKIALSFHHSHWAVTQSVIES